MKFIPKAAIAGSVLLLLVACPPPYVEIGEIKENPGDYDEGTPVTIYGTVTGVTGFRVPGLDIFKFKLFEVADETDSIIVSTEGNLPKTGDVVTVQGTVRTYVIDKDNLVYIAERHRRRESD